MPLDSCDRSCQTAVDRAQLHRGKMPQILCAMCVPAALTMSALAYCRKDLTKAGLGMFLLAVHGMHVRRHNGRVIPWFLHRPPNFDWE